MKSIATVLMLMLGTTLFAQIEAGNILITAGYELGFGYSQSVEINGDEIDDEFFEDVSQTSGLVRVDAQYAVADAISAGIVGRFGSFTSEPDDEDLDESKINVFEVGVEGRYSLVNSETANVYVAPSFGISSGKDDDIPDGADEDDFKYSGTFYQVAAGGIYFINEMVGVNARVGFGGHSWTNDNDPDNEVKLTSTGLEASAGVVILL